VTTMTKDGGRGASGHGGHSDRVNVAPTRDSLDKAARERKPGTYRGKSDDFPYQGPVVGVPDLGPDPLDVHGAPRAAQSQPSNDGEPGLSRRRIQELADWYKDETHRRYNEGRLDTAELDAELRLILREEVVFPEHVEIEFARVMTVVFAV